MLGRRKRSSGRNRRIFFATDIHGSEVCFRKWLNAARAYKAGVLILGGDITGKIVVPLVRGIDGRVRGEFAGEAIVVDGDRELESVERHIRDAGAYPLVLSNEEERRLAADAQLRGDAIDRCIRETSIRWRDLAEERLEASGAVAYMTLGNDDSEELAEIFAAGERLRYAEDRICVIDGAVELASFGYSTPTPWRTARELAEEELEARLRELVAGLSWPEQAILNVHCPPRDTAIDQAPQLDDQLRPRAGPGGGVVMEGVGSTAVRRIIENVRPQLALHGHVHESPGMARVGRTLCINPGSDYASGVLRGAIIDLDEAGSVHSWQLVQG